jgi:hypothetical protein
MLIPDVVADASKKQVRMLAPFDSMGPVRALDWALQGITDSYGKSTAEFVALQMEYPARLSDRARDDTR